MATEKLTIQPFLQLSGTLPVFDVRSPGEYQHAHIPGAISLPLFSDEERKVIGTAYKHEGRQPAIKIGLDYFGPKMKAMVEQVEAAGSQSVLVHCWRGGMRSGAVAWLLDLYGFKVHTLGGGYKTFRRWAIAQFEGELPLRLLGGFTGSGKTRYLKEVEGAGVPFLDLEGIAGHKGSAFGGIGLPKQPTQEMFENLLACKLATYAPDIPVWVEDESQRIGLVNLPDAFWARMRRSPLYFLDVPFQERLRNLLTEYGDLPKDQFADAITRIQKKLGGLEYKLAMQALAAGEMEACFTILLRYYDKFYKKALDGRTEPYHQEIFKP